MSNDDPLAPTFESPLELDRYALSTAVYAERHDGRILLLQRAEGSAMAGFYFLPGGLVDRGEQPFAAAERELFEESGLRFSRPPSLVGCYPMWIYGTDMLQLSFRGPVSGEVAVSAEHTDHRWVEPTEFAALFTDDSIAALAGDDQRISRLLAHIGEDVRRYLALIAER